MKKTAKTAKTVTSTYHVGPALVAIGLFIAVTQTASAQAVWTGGGGANDNWSDAANWGGTAPSPYNSLTFSAVGGTANNDFTGYAFEGIVFEGAAFNLTGNSILISGQAAGNNNGIANFSGTSQTVGINLNLDWGYYAFFGQEGGLTLSGIFNPSTNGLAFFDGNNDITCSSLTIDGTGLISGVGGQGLIFSASYNNGTWTAPVTPTGLATLSANGGTVQPYTGYTAQNPGNLPTSGNNLEFQTTIHSGTYALAGATTISTITSQQTGTNTTTNGITTDFINLAGNTLTLGNNGGIYVLANDLGNKSCLSILNGGWLTAGSSSSPASITFAVNGNNPNNQASVACGIEDNPSTGKVSVIYTGPGTLNFATSTSNSYSGGLYVTEGQVQFGQPTQLGTGPAYVASNANLYYTGSVAFSNTLNLSPGGGAPNGVVIETAQTQGAFVFNDSGLTMTNSFNLLGSPVTVGPGCRIGCNNTSTGNGTFTGQITGTGTLDLGYSLHSGTWVLKNPNTSGPNANNWQGGVLLDAPQGHAINADLQMGANNQIPSGANAGNVILTPAETTIYARFDLNGTSQTINGLVGNLGTGGASSNQLANFGSGASTLTLGANNATAIFTGYTPDSSGAPLNIVKIGTGTQIFNSPSSAFPFTYHGNTTVNAGTLTLSNYATIPNSPVITVASGAILDVTQLTAGALTVGASQTLNCVGTIAGNTTVNGTIKSLDSIGTLTASGNMTFNSGGTYVWDINNATGTAGADPGWSLLNIGGSLNLGSLGDDSFTIDITSLTTGDVVGNAANFSANVSSSWIIATAAGGISGFNASQFDIVTSGFANAPGSAPQWTVTQSGNNLALNYNAFSAIAAFTPLSGTETVLQNTAGPTGTATFTVTANYQGTLNSFVWQQNATMLTAPSGTTAGGGSYTIATSGAGTQANPYVSTLTITGLDATTPGGDDSTITATVNETYNSSPQMASTPTTLSVIDKPYNVMVANTNSPASVNYNFNAPYPWSGGAALLTSTASGTMPFTYQWYLNGNEIIGATSSSYVADITGTNGGNYTVVIGNADGSTASSTTTIGPAATYVPNQMIYEPFDSYNDASGSGGGNINDTFSIAEGITNLYNQLTSEPAYWTIDGSPANYSGIEPIGLDNGSENQFSGEYPWPGLAGNSINEFYWTGAGTHTRLRVTHEGSTLFAAHGANTNIYFSFLMSVVSEGNGTYDGVQSVFAGLTTSSGNEACNLEFWTQILSGGASTMLVGVGKGNGTTSGNPATNNLNTQAQLTNVLWAPMNSSPLGNNVWVQQTIVVVGCYTVNSGPGFDDDTVSLWINPPSSSFGAATPPTPLVGPTSFGGTIPNSIPQDFVLLPDYAPASHRVTDVRIGTTWASVTPPSAPTLTVNNVALSPCSSPAVAVFTSLNSGNPANSYSWSFNGGPALYDHTLGDGAVISGSSTGTLTISNATTAEAGTYTVTAMNTDPAPSDGNATLTGSASGTLTFSQPALYISYSGGATPSLVLFWLASSGSCYTPEQTTSLYPTPIGWSTVSAPVVVMGAYNTVTISPAPSVPTFYQLSAP